MKIRDTYLQVVNLKMSLYRSSSKPPIQSPAKQPDPTGEEAAKRNEYLKVFLTTTILPLWMDNWMQLNVLLHMSTSKPGNSTNQQQHQQQQLHQHTLNASTAMQPSAGQFVPSNAYPLTSSISSSNMNVSGNTSTMGNVSASPSSSVSSYLSMPSLSSNSFGFNQQQALLPPNHQMFQSFYQPQVMQGFGGNQQQAKNPNNFEDFNQQQQQPQVFKFFLIKKVQFPV